MSSPPTLRLWWYPPGARPLYTQPPESSHGFFQRPFFLWMPYKMWACRLVCPSCDTKLTGAGLYKTVRRVLDRDGWYFMGTEYLECRSCGKKIATWAQDIINQLDLSHQDQFPAVLTYKLSCHKSVILQMRQQTLGNSATCLRKQLVEDHTETWMSCTATYLGVLEKLGVAGAAVQPVTVPPLHPVPTVGWLLSVFVRDALSRLEATKARVTSIFGKILKMESTKKMTSKLAGKAAGTAAWVTNVGNEYGQVLMSVLTAAKGDGLLPLAAGLMRRYREAQVAPPAVLYVDRDCCSLAGRKHAAAMFSEWDRLVVRLDVWHLMQRFARGVTTESHQLYPQFMARLSYAIYLWDQDDLALLEKAKRAEEGRDSYIHLSAKELVRHCRRYTRGAAETERLIQELLDQFWDLQNNLGVVLIHRERMEAIWSVQRRHLSCIQDPPGVALYRGS
ncbi:uncharacterized protein LOC114850111 [Betta splendens]|uniref:Uncharacterized protein LOC114850111 n=1 Tax=Betta splendens TaxID=158456 RepID=A0A9W2XLT2_BETSP|nr:uncharacterized protein LOC114850111 [Betta splendens]